MVGVGVLGPLEIRDATGALVPITSLRQRRLLLTLVRRVGAAVDAHEVIELVWGSERLPDAPGAALHTIVARLRRTLPTGLAIVTGQHGYRLVVDDLDALDSHRFCTAIDRAQRQPDAALRLGDLTDAIGLVRGHPYAELDHPSVTADVTRLEELELAAHELYARSLIELDRPADAVVGLQTLVRRAPLRERSVALLMQALTDAGRQGDALGAYRRLRSELIEQLGIEPTAELRHLEECVLRQERSANGATARATPAPADSLIGRSEQIEQLLHAVVANQLVTLTGAGGVGKSTLARAAAERSTSAGQVVVCELATLNPGGDVAAAVATALAVRPRAGQSLVASVADALAGRRLLLVLDNCEHLIDGAAQLVAELAGRCPAVTILATSREPLRIAGEQLWPVAPLTERDGAALFRVRADNVGGAAVHDDGTIVELCRRLDGLPLAIELAAACVGSLTVHDLLDGLDDRFTLLERSTRRGTARHRSLAAMVAWSYELLDDDERRTFERVSVFSGRFDLAAAIPVAAIDGASPSRVRALLTSLVDKSMVTADVSGTRTRYRLLDTLRDYGVSRLAARHELDDARRGHLATFVELAERARREYHGCASGPGHEAFVDGWDDFRSAIEWAVADGEVAAADRLLRALFCFAFYGLRHELGRWAEHVLAVGPVDPLTAGIAAAFRSKQSDIRRARELAEIGLAASGSGRGDGAALCLFALADSCVHSGELAQTWSLACQGSAAVDDDGDPAVVTSAIAEAAYVGAMYDPPTADPFIDRLRSLAERIDDPGATYCIEIATALQALYGGSPEDAGTHALRAMEIADSMEAALHIAVARQVLAAWVMRTRRDDIDRTVADTLTYLYDVGDGGAWGILESVAIRWARLGRLDEAAVVLGYLERHALRYATNVVSGRRALARVKASPASAERLRYGESLDREEVVRFALAALRRGADRSSQGGQSRQMSAPRAASRPTRSS